jgi:hypothetical protein
MSIVTVFIIEEFIDFFYGIFSFFEFSLIICEVFHGIGVIDNYGESCLVSGLMIFLRKAVLRQVGDSEDSEQDYKGTYNNDEQVFSLILLLRSLRLSLMNFRELK